MYTDAYMPRLGSVLAFPVNLAPKPERPREWYLWEAKDIKKLRKACVEDRSNYPWALKLLQDTTYYPCIPKDWMGLAKICLSCTQFIKWMAFLKKCRGGVQSGN